MAFGLGGLGGNDIAVKIGLTGDKAFNKQIDQVSARTKKMGEIMNRGMNASILAGVAAFAAAIKVAADFETGMANVNTLLDVSDEQFGKLSDDVLG